MPVGTTFSFWIMLTAFYLSLSVRPCLSPSSAPPRFTKVPVDQIGVSGGVVSFVCQATGDPKPRVSWNKKGKKVNSQRIEVSQWAPLEGQLYGPVLHHINVIYENESLTVHGIRWVKIYILWNEVWKWYIKSTVTVAELGHAAGWGQILNKWNKSSFYKVI